MANPNIRNLETFKLENGGQALTSVSSTVVPAVGADIAMMLDTLRVADGSSSASAFIVLDMVQDGGTYNLATSTEVTTGTAVEFIERPLVMKETECITGRSVGGIAASLVWGGRTYNDA
jgi:stress response protein SCP2